MQLFILSTGFILHYKANMHGFIHCTVEVADTITGVKNPKAKMFVLSLVYNG